MHADIAMITRALDEAGLLVERRGTLPGTAVGIADDSRAVKPGGIFVAVRGTAADGHDYLDAAASAGAAMVIVEDAMRASRRAAALAAGAAYGWPARQLQLVGVTGTNGKTTTVNMLRHLLDDREA